MSYDYDALYAAEKNALGAPFAEFTAFFDKLPDTSLRVLDLGSGQGRDALFIARKGHHVTAVDLSPAGIADINAVANAEGLPITGVVADIVTYAPTDVFDIIVIDRTLHMLNEDDQVAVLLSMLNHIDRNGWILIADEKNNLPRFRDCLSRHAADWTITKDAKGFLFAQRA